jgi:hypothetical protein
MQPKKQYRGFGGLAALAVWAVLFAGCGDSGSPTSPVPFSPTPAPPGGDISGAWSGTYKTNDFIDCDATRSLAAQATFQQNGSRVSGTLTANGPCGSGYTFAGTLQGNTLEGEIAASGFGGGTAQGTLAGGNLIINAFNRYQYNMGQLQLHR